MARPTPAGLTPGAPVGMPPHPGAADTAELHPECARFGHNTKIRAGGLCFLICCFPCSMI